MFSFLAKDRLLFGSVFFLIIFSILILNSISSDLFPLYFLTVGISLLFFWFFAQIEFNVLTLFAKFFYLGSILLLLLPLIVGSVTRGTVRWVSVGSISFQPAEIVRPLLLVFFAEYLTRTKPDLKIFFKALILLFIPLYLILIQPSLGVSLLTFVGFFGVLLATNFNKRYILFGIGAVVLLSPVFWSVMAPYQKERLVTFINPSKDPLGAGYNSLQSVIAVGSGKFFGLGLGHGTQTQLSFLPEKQTDFIFASTAEELGFLGAGAILFATFIILYRLTHYITHSTNPSGRAFVSGFFLTYLVQVFVHVGMNIGLTPVTGVPFPLLSAGGSSLLATLIGLGIALGAYKR